MKDGRTLAEQARDALVGLGALAVRAPTIHKMSLSELEAFTELAKAGASDLNGAINRLSRMVRQQKKSGAAGAVHETRK